MSVEFTGINIFDSLALFPFLTICEKDKKKKKNFYGNQKELTWNSGSRIKIYFRNHARTIANNIIDLKRICIQWLEVPDYIGFQGENQHFEFFPDSYWKASKVLGW